MNAYLFGKQLKKINKHNRIILLEYAIRFYLFINLIHETTLRKLNLDSEITIVINGNGTQQILSTGRNPYYGSCYNELPNQILVNGILQNHTERYVYNLTQQINKITLKWNNQITNCNSMFEGLTNIIMVDLTKFDSSKVKYFDSFFFNCQNIKSINITYLNTSSSLNMAGMFYNLNTLETLNLSSFDTSKVTSFKFMFKGCKLLKSLDLSSFKTSKVMETLQLFYSCSSLIFLNIINFETSNVSDSSNMFYGINKNLVYCADFTKISKIKSLLSNYTNNCSEICFTNPKSKIIFEKKNVLKIVIMIMIMNINMNITIYVINPVLMELIFLI